MPGKLGSYSDIQTYVTERHGVVVKTCWIADVKEQVGLHPKAAPNRKGPERENPCPRDKIPLIEEALRHFGHISATRH